MRIRTLTLLPALATGCIPGRDNPNDPLLRPEAALSVVEHVENGACSSDFDDEVEWPVIGVGTRAQCLALDASKSTDPNQTPASLEYVFGFIASTGVAYLSSADGISFAEDGRVAILGPELRRTLPVDESITFFVQVTAADGVDSLATAALFLTNEGPQARAGSSRILASAGYPWTASPSYQLAFDSSESFDPDDPGATLLEYCWSFDGAAPICSRSPSEAAFTRTIDANLGRYVATLQVNDGIAFSEKDANVVEFGNRAIYLAKPSLGATAFEALDSSEIRLAPGLAGAAATYLARPPGQSRSMALLIGDGAGPAGSVSLASIVSDGTIQPPVAVSPLVPSRSSMTAQLDGWVFFVADAANQLLHVFDTFAGPIVELAPVSLAGLPAAERYEVATDESGAVWIAAGDAVTPEVLARVADGAGATVEIDSDAGMSVSSLALRPGAAEMWLSRIPTAAEAANARPGELQVWTTATPPALALSIPIPGPSLRAPLSLGWVGADRLWVLLAGEGLVLLDADALRAGIGFDAASRQVIPDSGFESPLFVDVDAGVARVRGADGNGSPRLFAVETNGETRGDAFLVDPAGAPLETPVAIDAEGFVWFALSSATSPHGFVYGRYADGGSPGFVASAANASSPMAIDRTTGGLILAEQLPGGSVRVLRYAPDGTLLSNASSFVSPNGVPAVLTLGSAELAGDASAMWSVDAGVLRRVDLRSATPVVHVLPGTPADGLLGVTPASITTAENSVIGGRAWVYTTAPLTVWNVDTAGVAIPTNSFGNPAEGFLATITPGSGDLCLLTVETAPDRYRVTRVDAEGDVHALALLPDPAASGGIRGHAITAFSKSGNCWLARSEGLSAGTENPSALIITNHTNVGLPPETLSVTIPGRIVGFAPIDPLRIYVLVGRGAYDFELGVVRSDVVDTYTKIRDVPNARLVGY